jgi:hypothetical protein
LHAAIPQRPDTTPYTSYSGANLDTRDTCDWTLGLLGGESLDFDSMNGGSPIVPVLLPSGAIHFAKVNPSDTGQEIINVLLATEGIKAEILGELEHSVGEGVDWGWSLQHVRKYERGKVWQDEELGKLDDGS